MTLNHSNKSFSPPPIFQEQNSQELSKNYILLLQSIFLGLQEKNPHFSSEDVFLSSRALKDAIIEIKKDVNIIVYRRNHPELSPGKYAGIVAFRLSRWNIISTKSPIGEDKAGIKLNHLVAVAFSLKYCLNIGNTVLSDITNKELLYTIARRHTNQETLGLCFDVIKDSYSNEDPLSDA